MWSVAEVEVLANSEWDKYRHDDQRPDHGTSDRMTVNPVIRLKELHCRSVEHPADRAPRPQLTPPRLLATRQHPQRRLAVRKGDHA